MFFDLALTLFRCFRLIEIKKCLH